MERVSRGTNLRSKGQRSRSLEWHCKNRFFRAYSSTVDLLIYVKPRPKWCPFYTYRRTHSSAGMIRFHDNLQSVIIMDRGMSRRPPDCVPACCKYLQWGRYWYLHMLSVFVARPHLVMNTMRDMAVRPYVCPSVGSGHADVLAKRLNISSKFRLLSDSRCTFLACN